MLEVGSIVGDRFRIERILGKGGMGVVATHLQLEPRSRAYCCSAPGGTFD